MQIDPIDTNTSTFKKKLSKLILKSVHIHNTPCHLVSPTFTFAYLRCMMTYDVFGRNRTLQTEVEVPMHQTPCPLNGKWGSWTPWSPCNADCGGGTKTRRRECNRPLPSNGGDHCDGHSDETEICNVQSCSTNPPPVDGGWSH